MGYVALVCAISGRRGRRPRAAPDARTPALWEPVAIVPSVNFNGLHVIALSMLGLVFIDDPANLKVL